jgi:DNA mismatch endonuclease (patch repair protein)
MQYKSNDGRLRRDYTRSSLTQVKSFTRTRNGNVQEIEPTVRGNIKTFLCKECGVLFSVKGNRIVRKFCSMDCYRKDWGKRIPGHNRGQTGKQISWNKGLTKETSPIVARYTISMARTVRKQFKDGSRRVNGFRHWKDTDIEILLGNALSDSGISFKKNYPINLRKFSTFPDFFIKESKLCIYADGEYWHNYPHGTERDIDLSGELKDAGYQVLRFWGKEIKKELSACVNKIKEKI